MSSFLDTSVLLRYITGDPPHQLPAARDVIDSEERLVITDVAIAEAAFAMGRFYNLAREEVVDSLVEVLQRANIDVFGLNKDIVIDALQMCRPSNRISFADALMWAAARSDLDAAVYTFDARFPSRDIKTIRLR